MIKLPPYSPPLKDEELFSLCERSLEVLKSDVLFSDEKIRQHLQDLVLVERDRVLTRMRYPKRKDRPRLYPYKGHLTMEELAYYGSELNREIYLRSFSLKDRPDKGFESIPEKLRRLGRPATSQKQSTGNIDLVSVKEDLKRIQLIESKHLSERSPSEGQKKIFAALGKAFSDMNSRRIQSDEWQYEFYLIRADYPYTEAYVKNLLSGYQSPERRASEKELFDLLSFRIQFEEIKGAE
jgi:hypothetical protein